MTAVSEYRVVDGGWEAFNRISESKKDPEDRGLSGSVTRKP